MPIAKDETTAIIRATGEASDALRYFDGRVYNGHGELSDPSNARSYLRQASRAILEAMTALDRAEKVGWSQHD